MGGGIITRVLPQLTIEGRRGALCGRGCTWQWRGSGRIFLEDLAFNCSSLLDGREYNPTRYSLTAHGNHASWSAWLFVCLGSSFSVSIQDGLNSLRGYMCACFLFCLPCSLSCFGLKATTVKECFIGNNGPVLDACPVETQCGIVCH